MQYVELYVKNPEDPDTQERKKHYFIRKRGFNFLELITIPRSHELFKEDTLLGKHKDYIKETDIKKTERRKQKRTERKIERKQNGEQEEE